MTQKKYLIVGAGLAGITLSIHLIKSGHKVTLLSSNTNRSSKIAAGLINPIVFRRMTKSWKVDEFLPFAQQFYETLEKESNSKFYFPIIIRRMFSSEQERFFWLEKQEMSEFDTYLTKITEADNNFHEAINEFGSGRVKNASYISTEIFLEETIKWIQNKATVIEESLNYLDLNPETLLYKEEKFDGVVFCEGADVLNNPWFKDLPINPTKGETLTIRSESIIQNESLNRKCFVLPLGNNEFKLGSTYVWNTYNDIPTEDGKKEILENLTFLTKEKPEIINHQAGIRPTTMDRRPVMGTHPTHPGLFIFNGLGAKGYLLAPLLALEMTEFLLGKRVLDKDVKNNRYYK